MDFLRSGRHLPIIAGLTLGTVPVNCRPDSCRRSQSLLRARPAIGRIRLALDAEGYGGGVPGFPVGDWGRDERVCAGFEPLAAETACETEAVSAS